jgi:hypothetical protein
MKSLRFFALAGLAAGSIFVAGSASAQTMYDKVIVDLPYAVTINNTTLQPGHYVIRQLETPGQDSKVLQIFGDSGMKLEAAAMTIATLDNNTPQKTDIVLHHFGNDYFFDKIWIQGKNYGYEFPLPPSVKAREKERMTEYTVAAKYEAKEQTQVAESTPPPAPAPAPEPAPVPEVAAPAPAPEPTPAPAPAPETNTMPTTADGWGLEVVAGIILAAAGLTVRRRTVTNS